MTRHWSDQHHALLLHCAKVAIKKYGYSHYLELDDLVSEGWLRALRHRAPDQLRGCGTLTIMCMRNAGDKAVTGVSHWHRSHGRGHVIPFDDDADWADDRRTPYEIAEEKDVGIQGSPKHTEAVCTREFCKLLEAAGAKVIALVGGTMQEAGLPDRYIVHPVFRGWLEFKRADNPLSALQRKFLQDAARLGDVAMVVRFSRTAMTQIQDADRNLLKAVDLRTLSLHNKATAGKLLLQYLADAWKNFDAVQRINKR